MAIVVVAFVWSLQHAFMPLTFDTKFMAYRLLSSPPLAIFETLLYLRLRRLVPLAIAHALMDGATVLIPLAWPRGVGGRLPKVVARSVPRRRTSIVLAPSATATAMSTSTRPGS